MKLLVLLIVCAVCAPAFADWRIIGRPRYGLPITIPEPQTPEPPAPPPAAPEYNPEDYRISNGVLYNIKLSKRWGKYIRGFDMTVIKVLHDGVVFRLYEKNTTEVELSRTTGSVGGSYVGLRTTSTHTSMVPDGSCFIKNFPHGKLTEGEWVDVPLYVICIPVPIKYGGETVPVYDFGLPNTPENRKLLKAPGNLETATNAVAIK
jgi:hypothetical protein